jgi:endonuclease/exonuclease/phosphatase (EEP) superfamily protein YafD
LAIYVATLGPLVCFAARSWWIFDLASHFRLQYVFWMTAGTILFAGLRMWELAALSGVLLVVHARSLWPFYAPRTPGKARNSNLRVVSINVWNQNDKFGLVLDFVRRVAPDIAVFLEINSAWESALGALGDGWRYSHVHAPYWSRGIAVYSRLPFDTVQVRLLTDAVPAVVVEMSIGGTPFSIVAAHPSPPVSKAMSEARDAQLKELAELLAAMPGHTNLIGDLNTSSWSSAFRDLIRRARMRDSRERLGVQPSWPSFLPRAFRIPLDHCLVSPGIHVAGRTTGPNVGSDHLPVVVDLAIPATDT